MAFLSRLLGGKKAVENKHPRVGNASIAAHPPRAFPVPRTFPTEVSFRLAVVGAQGCGKSAAIRRYCANSFNQAYTPTIGPELRVVQLTSQGAKPSDPVIFLELIEVAHQELRTPRLHQYLEGIHGAIVVFDISTQSSLPAVDEWSAVLTSNTARFREADSLRPLMLLLANKTDVGPMVASEVAIDKYCEDAGFQAWSLCSAKDGSGVKGAIDRHVEAIIEACGLERRGSLASIARQQGAQGGHSHPECPTHPHYVWCHPECPTGILTSSPQLLELGGNASDSKLVSSVARFCEVVEARLAALPPPEVEPLQPAFSEVKEKLEALVHQGPHTALAVYLHKCSDEWGTLVHQLEASAAIAAAVQSNGNNGHCHLVPGYGPCGGDTTWFHQLFMEEWGDDCPESPAAAPNVVASFECDGSTQPRGGSTQAGTMATLAASMWGQKAMGTSVPAGSMHTNVPQSKMSTQRPSLEKDEHLSGL